MKKVLAVLMTLVLLAGLVACGKETVEPVDDEERQQISAAADAEAGTTYAPPEAAAEAAASLADGETGMLSYTKLDAKTGTLTISGIQAFILPGDYDVSPIKRIVIAEDVLSADLETGQSEYSGLEAIECSPACDVSVSASAISRTPFYQNSANWTDGVLYIGSRLAAINEDAPTVCKLSSNISSIDWDLKEDIAETAPQIERFEMDKGNNNYQTDNFGVLYSTANDSLEIALFPPASPAETYDLPDEIETLQFPLSEKLKTIHISAKSNLTEIQFGESGVSAISSYRVDDGHPSLYAKDGVLFGKSAEDGSVQSYILDYPGGKASAEYTIPDGTAGCSGGAFRGCRYLETLHVPASMCFEVYEGSFSAFDGCKKLAHVYVDADNETLRSTKDGLPLHPFRDDTTQLIYLPGRTDREYTIPSGIAAFEACGNNYIETLVVGKDIEYITVDECPALQAFRAEGSKHGYYTKDGSLLRKWQPEWEKSERWELVYYPTGKKDKQYTVPDGVTYLNGSGEWNSDTAFHNNPYIEEIIVPDSVTFIGMGVFAGCTSLTKVRLPDTLKNLGDVAFYGCTSLKEITIPASLEALGYYDGIDNQALFGSSITDIYYQGTQAQWNQLVNAMGRRAILPSGVRVHCTDD